MQLHHGPELVIRPGPFQSHLVSRVNVPKRAESRLSSTQEACSFFRISDIGILGAMFSSCGIRQPRS